MAFNPAMDVGPVNPSGGGGGGSSMLAGLVLGGLGGLGNFFGQQAQAKAQKEMEKMRIAEAQRAQNQDVGLKESTLDPFRQQMQQARNLSMLDMRERTQPTSPYGLSERYANLVQAPVIDRTQPRTPSYTPSPDLLNWLSMIKQNVAGGQNQAPTMTNPGNYGKTSALDLLALQRDPTQAGYARGALFGPRPMMPALPAARAREMY
jgi:hypothetical protein